MNFTSSYQDLTTPLPFKREFAFQSSSCAFKPCYETGVGYENSSGDNKSQAKFIDCFELSQEDPNNRVQVDESDQELASAPSFIQSELCHSNGRGPYGHHEQLIILLYGYQFFYSKNVYSIISRKMNEKRNRASVRQKLEQIVHKASGQQYGSLLHRRDEVLPILRREFWRILYLSENGSQHEQQFAAKIKALAQSINMPEQVS